jgi:hypothetical protein
MSFCFMAIRSFISFATGARPDLTKPRAGASRVSWTTIALRLMGFAAARRMRDARKLAMRTIVKARAERRLNIFPSI